MPDLSIEFVTSAAAGGLVTGVTAVVVAMITDRSHTRREKRQREHEDCRLRVQEERRVVGAVLAEIAPWHGYVTGMARVIKTKSGRTVKDYPMHQFYGALYVARLTVQHPEVRELLDELHGTGVQWSNMLALHNMGELGKVPESKWPQEDELYSDVNRISARLLEIIPNWDGVMPAKSSRKNS